MNMQHRTIIATLLLSLLAGCDNRTNEQKIADATKAAADAKAQEAWDNGQVTLVATAPDGTKLWAVKAGYEPVYFSSAGTDYIERRGKQTIKVNVPNAPGK